MDQQKGGFFGSFGGRDQSANIPVTSTPNSVMSPYLNFDPAYIGPSPGSEFIFPEGASAKRGRFELAFSQIGGSVIVGAGFGGVNGFFHGLKEVKANQLTGAVRRTQMLNFIAKQGASSAQSLGVIALMYSIFGVIISYGRGVEDEANTVTAGTLTGLLYKSSAGWKKCARAGGIGFGLASAYCLFMSKDKVKDMMNS
ncbi:mitochondrial import inner membrane translocase subunit Tim23-like [Tubulanus polymorphus]|uniref:mitochondrial import inner membrane translocase subunit Tim23-like n=1 Tax=Tubulanus polymorphus TaxID=672921 RepID=UPI003DA63E4B